MGASAERKVAWLRRVRVLYLYPLERRPLLDDLYSVRRYLWFYNQRPKTVDPFS